MTRYLVSGTATVHVYVSIEAESPNVAKSEALELGVRYWDRDDGLLELDGSELSVEVDS